MENVTILIVEDDDLTAFLLRKNLISKGFNKIEMVDNANSAIECATTKNIDLVVMDVDIIGNVDGIEAARIIRMNSSIPIIFHTNNDMTLISNRMNGIENTFYIEKDGIYHKLVNKVKTLIDSSFIKDRS